jgi:DNA-binding transcriptional ArsR family regulator
MKYIIDGTASTLMHPSRYQIIQCLRDSSEPLFVDQISKETGINPRMVSHHLDILEEKGLVECAYEISKTQGSKRGIAIRLCLTTSKVDEVFQDIKESMKK